MKKSQMSGLLLSVSIAFVANSDMVIAAPVHSKSVTKQVTNSQKKITKKTASFTQSRKMTEKDITECTQLINKVAQSDKILQNEMISKVASDSKLATQLKKPSDAQVFASDDPIAVAHLTGKSATLPIAQSSKAIPSAAVAKLTPPPSFKPTTATLVASSAKPPKSAPTHSITRLPPNSQVFASDDPKVLANLTGKITPPITESRYTTAKSLSAKPLVDRTTPKPLVGKPLLTKSTELHPQSRIKLFEPNSPDLDHLEGKSASLASVQNENSVSTRKKTETSGHKAKTSGSAKNQKK